MVPTSGNFALTGDVSFTGGFGLVSPYFKTSVINPASTGFLRLAKTDTLDWRNNANSANLPLAVNGSDQLTFNGAVVSTVGSDVSSITGTANQVIASSATGAVTLSLPQNIATTSLVQFGQVEVGTSLTSDGIVTFANHTNSNTAHLLSGITSSTYSLTLPVALGTTGQVLTASDNTGTLGWTTPASGSVSSVAMTVPTFLSVSGSPITSSGTLAVSLSGTAIPVLNGGTGVTTSTGTGSNVLSTSPTLVTPLLGTPTSATLTNATGLPLTTGVTGTLPVSNGGTGGASFTAYSVLCGGTTSTGSLQNVVGVGSSGQFLQSSGASALPVWATVGGSGTVNSGTAGQLAYYATSTNAVSTMPQLSVSASGATTFTVDGSGVGAGATMRVLGSGVTTANLGLQAAGGAFTISSSGTTTYKLTDTTNAIDFLTYTHPAAGLLTSAVPIAMGSNKITGLAAGTSGGDALSYGQTGASLSGPIFSGSVNLSSATGSRIVTTDPFKNLDTSSTVRIASNTITGLANGGGSTDAATFGQIKVIQIVYGTSTTAFTTSSAGFQTTNLSVNISPTSSSNRVLILASGTLGNSAGSNDAEAAVYRGAVKVATTAEYFIASTGSVVGQIFAPCTISCIDSPATTSSTTYAVKVGTGAGTVSWGDAPDQTIIAVEII